MPSNVNRIFLASILSVAVPLLLGLPVMGQGGPSVIISGTVTSQGAAVGGADVALRGVIDKNTKTDAKGTFTFSAPPGRYQIIVSKVGFLQVVTFITVAPGENPPTSIALTQQSFVSLRTIGRVSTNTPGHAQINQGPASISVIPGQVFADQGQTQVMNVLNQTPGIITWGAGSTENGADEDNPQTIQIRGALPYETETLIDGHATPISIQGYFDPSLLNPAMLQNVEVVKGPGSQPPEINYAVGGTVNFITLQPTIEPQFTLMTQLDNWGGIATAIQWTGSTTSKFLQWAAAYATNGAPGPLQNYPVPGSVLFPYVFGNNFTVNGKPFVSSPLSSTPASPESYYGYAGFAGRGREGNSVWVCCSYLDTSFHSTNELGKVRLNFSQSTALTLSFLGGADFGAGDNVGVAAVYSPIGYLPETFDYFSPPPGYHGSIAAGTPMPFNESAFFPIYNDVQQYLYQAEFRTTFGPWTALARYYDGGNNNGFYLQTGPNGLYSITGNAWGGGLLCPEGTALDSSGKLCNPGGLKPTMTYFNGQNATFTSHNAQYGGFNSNHELGETLEFIRPFSNGSNLTFSFDRHSQSGYEYGVFSGAPPYYPLPPGASQLFDTESLRFDSFVAPKVQMNLATYAIQYQSHFTDNGGGLSPGEGPASWHDATSGYVAPRIAFVWHPNDDTSYRLAMGSSIAPPYLSLLSSPGSLPIENVPGQPAEGYTENLNTGSIAPETAFGYDIGFDKRIHRSMYVSVDAYLTTLHNMYLPSTYLINQNYVPPGGCPVVGDCPLFASATENLGRARYEGIEAEVGNAPSVGFGYKLQGTLMRAYAYDLPPGFYCTNVPANKCTPFNYNTNLGIIPNINFQQSGLSFSAINGAAVPYSMGYGEVNYRMRTGTFFHIGATYFGSNNSYSEPAFAVMNMGITQPFGKNFDLQLTGNNLNGAYDSRWASYTGGIPAVLAPTCLGKYGTPAQDLHGLPCTSAVNSGAVPRKDVVVISQQGLTSAGNYGPATFQLRITEKLGSP